MQNKLINTVRFIVALISFLVALAAIPLMAADYMTSITAINATLAHYWPAFLAGATIIDRAGKMVIALLIRWFPAAAATLLCVLLSACGTTLYNPHTNGKLAVFRSDITEGEYTGGDVRFKFKRMSNSSPTRAALMGTSKIIRDSTSGALPFFVPGTGATPALERTVTSSLPHLLSPNQKEVNINNQ